MRSRTFECLQWHLPEISGDHGTLIHSPTGWWVSTLCPLWLWYHFSTLLYLSPVLVSLSTHTSLILLAFWDASLYVHIFICFLPGLNYALLLFSRIWWQKACTTWMLRDFKRCTAMKRKHGFEWYISISETQNIWREILCFNLWILKQPIFSQREIVWLSKCKIPE
jgi:hypothetical protein